MSVNVIQCPFTLFGAADGVPYSSWGEE